eukprot:CAMPEP_0174718578 /NCGR_PEP_ID=MMETSP1094-20130205/29390_1 /TAXON_ID=156173 /ORGANISM="Chrysochromulina brevifilum, Strain UTEX LB 985" /LENGTH=119 /DNA_ID=CAMNT_0015918715 /DNA_START=415 /DNA_END=776 /DNA_ORIENTATION=+
MSSPAYEIESDARPHSNRANPRDDEDKADRDAERPCESQDCKPEEVFRRIWLSSSSLGGGGGDGGGGSDFRAGSWGGGQGLGRSVMPHALGGGGGGLEPRRRLKGILNVSGSTGLGGGD